MATRGRHTLFDDTLAAQIVELLAKGCIIADVCSKVGISQTSYFAWLHKFPEFAESVNRAKAEANVGAVESLRTAMQPHDVVSKTVKTLKETRLRKARVNFGTKDKPQYAIEEVPYEYSKTEQSATVTNEFDWRAALEFLKRRDPDNWSEAFIIKVSPEDADLLKQLGFKSAHEAFQALIERARKRVEDGQS